MQDLAVQRVICVQDHTTQGPLAWHLVIAVSLSLFPLSPALNRFALLRTAILPRSRATTTTTRARRVLRKMQRCTKTLESLRMLAWLEWLCRSLERVCEERW